MQSLQLSDLLKGEHAAMQIFKYYSLAQDFLTISSVHHFASQQMGYVVLCLLQRLAELHTVGPRRVKWFDDEWVAFRFQKGLNIL